MRRFFLTREEFEALPAGTGTEGLEAEQIFAGMRDTFFYLVEPTGRRWWRKRWRVIPIRFSKVWGARVDHVNTDGAFDVWTERAAQP